MGQLVLSTASTNKDCDENPEDCDDPIQDIAIERRIIHPRYDQAKLINNIALLKLKSPADLKVTNVNTICLPTADAEQYDTLVDSEFGGNMMISGKSLI